ncbi:UDP-N-acetylglucosamine 2-epimerase [Flagellimonas sp. 389]|uniref:UDP-N-acetylglucosamine 2-epimerase n=1 Tax=Flagellimonas sp. 389 TaxID=2835862 RepID=UPI001BD3C8A1|nr:UDP-N-acetylglucosamine 2-epimerase [Flagellimonas sp. 389]MBS9461271.1 UDP-N-acetylglucosamine 2-epimerase [Flagellimonas sp. 389]
MKKKRNLIVFGTRVCVTAQHREMLGQVLTFSEIEHDLPTFDKKSPFSEEINRCVIGVVSDIIHFAPTNTSTENLLLDNIKQDNIVFVVNTANGLLNLDIKKVE